MTETRRFRATANSVPAARRFVLDSLPGVSPDLADVVSLLVSELATNAVLHARSDFEVRVDLTSSAVRVEVIDEGGGEPVARPFPPASQMQGRGLAIVMTLADAWGINERPDPGKGVWAEVNLSSKIVTAG